MARSEGPRPRLRLVETSPREEFLEVASHCLSSFHEILEIIPLDLRNANDNAEFGEFTKFVSDTAKSENIRIKSEGPYSFVYQAVPRKALTIGFEFEKDFVKVVGCMNGRSGVSIEFNPKQKIIRYDELWIGERTVDLKSLSPTLGPNAPRNHALRKELAGTLRYLFERMGRL